MPKVTAVCGKICSGKTTYAKELCRKNRAVLLSCDEITLALFENGAGEMHDIYVQRLQKYLLEKSLEIVKTGIDVVLDWGFWTNASRTAVRAFYKEHGIEFSLYYIDISDALWQKRIAKRNADVLSGICKAYYIDRGLAEKFRLLFEEPDKNTVDFLINHS